MIHRDLAGKRILVVEDELLVVMLVEEILSAAGCVVVGPFARVGKAVAAARVEAVDAAVLDVNVAGEAVFPVALELQKRGVPFLFVTGYGEAALPRDHPEWEALSKPFRSNQLTDNLARRIKAS